MPAPDTITPDKLARLIGTPACPYIIDVREAKGSYLLPVSVPRDLTTLADWSTSISGRPAVVVDEAGRAHAHGAAATLRAHGNAAEVLEGGFDAWRAAGHPVLRADHLPPRHAEGATLWVTRARPKVDRIACPWLIRRFVDPEARFLFVPPSEVLAVAERFGAEPFDVEGDGVFWSHRGERCTFDLMLETFGLEHLAALAQLATVVRGADTDRLDIAPEAAGLLAISLGLSRLYADDLEQLEAGMLVYDALYRWARDARGETHNWASHAAARVKVGA
jgi:rhodanese-related sulfurtransferase